MYNIKRNIIAVVTYNHMVVMQFCSLLRLDFFEFFYIYDSMKHTVVMQGGDFAAGISVLFEHSSYDAMLH